MNNYCSNLKQNSFKSTFNWNKDQSEPTIYTQNRYLNHLFNPNLQVANSLFVLSFKNDAHRRRD